MMSSYGGGRSAVCAECYREHCRPRRPAVPSVRTAAAAAPTEAVTPPDGRPRSRPCRRSDQALRDCQLFIAGSFVVGLILVQCAMSAPVKPPQSQSSQEQQQQTDSPVPTDPPFWYNPCGMPFDGSGGGGSGGMTMETDSAMRRDEADIIDGVLVTASSALMHAEQFAGSFVNETFKIDIKQLHERFKDSILTWVQQTKYMPKELDVSLDESYLVGLTFKGVLHAVYVGLQNLAVGLEQVVWDQNREGLPFLQDFKETTFKLKAILCEVSMAIYDINETPEQYVTRDIMPEESRTSDNQRSLRDWLILREYITGLQYVIETFEYLKSKR